MTKDRGAATVGAVAVVLVVAVLGNARCALGFIAGMPRSTLASGGGCNRSAWGKTAARSLPQDRAACTGRSSALSMVSATFGEKVNLDKIVMDKTAAEAIEEEYSEAIGKNPGFLEEIGHGDTKAYTEDELRRRLEVAHVFVKMANLVILSRGMNILSEDFKYYSPGTGKLDRERFLRLTKTLDVGFSSFTVYPTNFTVYKDGVVSFKRSFRTIHDGYLKVGDKTYPPTNKKVISDVDLCTCSFDDDGLIRSYTYGLMVELVFAVEDLDAVAEIKNIEKRVVNQKAKMESLAGQETSIAYSKCKADIDSMLLDKEKLEDKVNSAPNTEGLGGIPGLFAAVGAEFPKDLTSLEGTDAYGDIEGRRIAGFSFPVEVRDYAGFDMDAFKDSQFQPSFGGDGGGDRTGGNE